MKLRPYQQQAINDLRDGLRAGHKRQMLALSTGAGKTIVAARIALSAREKGQRILFVVDRVVLVEQAVVQFQGAGLRVGVLQGENTDYNRDDDIIVASIQTVRTRSAPHWVRLVFIDEAHVLHKAHRDLMEHWSALPFIGLSATPLTRGLGKLFSNLVRGPSIRQLVDEGSLVRLRGYAPSERVLRDLLANAPTRNYKQGRDYQPEFLSEKLNRKELVADVVKTYQQHGEGRPALVFAVDVAHSKALCADFEIAGYAAAHVDGYMAAEEAYALIEDYRAGRLQVLSSVAKLGIGFDCPAASCAILARPTMSLMLHLQQLGRIMRPAGGKVDGLILDHAGNVARHGLPIEFEVPDLDGGVKETSAKRSTKPLSKPCNECGYVLEPGQQVCPNCGIERLPRPTEVYVRDGELMEIGAKTGGEKVWDIAARREWYRMAMCWFLERGKKRGAAFFAYQEKFGEKPPPQWKGLSSTEPDDATAKWLQSRRIRAAKRFAKKNRVAVGSLASKIQAIDIAEGGPS